MTKIDLPLPVALGAQMVSAFTIAPLSFLDYAALAAETSDIVAITKGRYETAFQRGRLLKQCSGLTADGAAVALDDETLTTLPLPVARQLLAAVDETMALGKQGTILSMMADGVTAPILYKLGSPIATGGIIGEEGKAEAAITELEFLAPNFGALEDVLAADTKLSQTVALIEHVAHPVEMIGMPSWAARQITISDGLGIMNLVLPRFLG